MSSLYNLTAEYQVLLAKDEYCEEDLQKLDALHVSIEDRAIHYAYLIKTLQSKLHLTSDAIKSATEKKKRLEKNIADLESYVLAGLKNANIERVDKDPMFDVIRQVNQPSVDDYDPMEIPSEYWVKKESLSLDKNKIKADIENLGLVIPGARLVRKEVLKIK